MSPCAISEGTLAKAGTFGLPTFALLLVWNVAACSGGGERTGTDVPPAVVTLGGSATAEGATLNGTVNPNGRETGAWFEWGIDPNLASCDNTTKKFVGSGTVDQPISDTIAGLASWKTYYFRVAASGVGETVRGTIEKFPSGEYYVAVGDSITQGSMDDFPDDDTSSDGRDGGGGYEPVLNDLLTGAKGYPHTVRNEGISRGNAMTDHARMPAVVAAHPDAAYFLVLYGTNDADIGYPSGRGLGPLDAGYDGTFKDYLQRILWAIADAGKKPCLAKIPCNDTDPNWDARIREYNLVIDELVAENSIPVAPPDFYTHFRNHPDELADGIHPNGAGYRSMASLWAAALTP